MHYLLYIFFDNQTLRESDGQIVRVIYVENNVVYMQCVDDRKKIEECIEFLVSNGYTVISPYEELYTRAHRSRIIRAIIKKYGVVNVILEIGSCYRDGVL